MKRIILCSSLLVSSLCFGQNISTYAGNGIQGFAGDGGQATAAELYWPMGMAMDVSGNIYISDAGNNRIRKINSGGIITTFAGNGFAGFSGDGGQATNAELQKPYGLEIDASGNLYTADFANNCIRKISTSGIISTLAGNGTAGFSGDGAAATACELSSPCGLAFDASGNLYIADDDNSRIRKINPAGVITTIAGNGIAGYSGDGGMASSAELWAPTGLTVDATGNIYIADGDNNVIRKVSSSGIITRVAGTGYMGYTGDGVPATSSGLFQPTGVAVDNVGNIYIADFADQLIRKVNTLGIISSIAGTVLVANYSGDGGPATAAELNAPVTIKLDALGNIYIADEANNRIRVINGITGQNEFEINNNELGIYPNPSKGYFTIHLPNSCQLKAPSLIEVYNMLGEKVFEETLSQAQGDNIIDLSTQPNGVYLVKVQSNDGTVMSKKISIVR